MEVEGIEEVRDAVKKSGVKITMPLKEQVLRNAGSCIRRF
jgi:hypothetical protein